MTKLEQIGVTALTGLAVYSVSIFLFGIANYMRITHIAPRAEARPRNVIYNRNPTHPSQDRGNPWFGWIPWVLKLSYEDMLMGVPGTGTRDGGLAGRNLRVNLDNIVMLRFHSFGLRVTTLALFLYMLVLLPLNWTANCAGTSPIVSGNCTTANCSATNINVLGNCTTANCSTTNLVSNLHCAGLTNYDRTTLANIGTESNAGTGLIGLSARLYVVVICSWIMTCYACYELRQEWVDILAMRRFYFLESNHWKRQQDTMKRTRLPSHMDVDDEGCVIPKRGLRRAKKSAEGQEPDYLSERQPWIPNPEAPDTPPPIALYSVLVGGIPSKPAGQEPPTPKDPESSQESHDMDRANLYWQLSVTSAFFDHCVPNQPGFSSSVAAVTILPKASEIATAWKSWYRAASKLRRLRFIRKEIKARRKYEIELQEEDVEGGKARKETAPSAKASQFISARSIYNDDHALNRIDYNRDVLGSAFDDEVEDLFLEALNFGPEQTAVYSREFAQSAAPCCPNGCHEEALMDASIDELLDLEQIAVEEVQAANKALEIARSNAVTNARSKEHGHGRTTPPKEPKSTNNSPKRDSNIDSAQKSRHNRGSLRTQLPIDLASVKNIVGTGSDKVQNLLKNDRMKNLMGKDSSLPNSEIKGHRKTGSLQSFDTFELEGKLWGEKHSNHKSFIKRPAPIKEPVKSAPMPKTHGVPASNSDPEQRNKEGHHEKIGQHNRSRTEVDKFGIPVSFGNKPKIWDENTLGEALNDSHTEPEHSFDVDLSHIDLSPMNSFDGSYGSLHPLKRNGVRASEPVMNANADSSLSPLRPAELIRGRSNSEPKLRVDTNVGSLSDAVRTSHRAEATYSSPDDAWALVDSIAHQGQDQLTDEARQAGDPPFLSTGNWELSSLTEFLKMPLYSVMKILRWTSATSNKAVDLVAGDSTYAVVTFTSRQAALAARKCLADGRASDRWVQIDTLPIPPLADAAPCDLVTCRGCCRPVTLTVNDKQKQWRFYLALICLGTIYFLYTIPLTAAASFANSQNLNQLFPKLQHIEQGNHTLLTANLLSSLIAALIWALFFSFCPMMFKMIANFGSNATSIVEAEYQALQYFWWFMVVSAFSGSSLQRMVLDGFNDGIAVGREFQSILRSIAATVPAEVSASWINWIIVKYSITLPLQYMLQLNTFVFSWLRMKCCVRLVRGGGPGGPVPFRIYVDSGMVLLCVFALAPASPLVAPFAFMYFLVSTPMLRRNVIYMYRPKFDGGGIRWPFIFDMVVSSMFVSQILLSTMMALKQAIGPAVLAALPFVPTLLFRESMRNRFLRSFSDVALLQTSLLDGWDTTEPTSEAKREEFRQFLVDSHKAAYVPVCVAGTQTDEFLTAEPAIILPTIEENQVGIYSAATTPVEEPEIPSSTPVVEGDALHRETSDVSNMTGAGSLRNRNPRNQFATLRRASTIFASGSGRNPRTPNQHGRFSMISDTSSQKCLKEK